MIIKIYGERNSATSFLEFLLRANVIDEKNKVFKDSISFNKKSYCWKHGIPREFDVNLLANKPKNLINEEDVLYICIFRNLEDWLKSMYTYPHHLKNTGRKIESFQNFIRKKHKIIRKSTFPSVNDYHTNLLPNEDDNGKTIFQIRYNKLIAHIDFFAKQSNIIHINTTYLQENIKFFLDVLSHIYKIKMKEKLILNIPYTKEFTCKGFKLDKNNNTIYEDIKIEKYKNFIDKQINKHYEKYVNTLTIRCKINGNLIN